jgi:hypothetical protein
MCVLVVDYFLASIDAIRVVAQFGSALDWGSRGRWFESSPPDHKTAGQRLKPLTFFVTW